ncbi:MAG: hypothetical protein AAF705_16510, partial [Bacteroidota bacterium]
LNNTLSDASFRQAILETAPNQCIQVVDGKNKTIQELSSFEPKVARPALRSQMEALSKQGEDLVADAKAIAEKGKELEKEYTKVNKKADAAAKELEKRQAATEDLSKQIAAIDQKKMQLSAALAEKPKKSELEALTKEVNQAEKDAQKFAKALEEEQKKKADIEANLANLNNEKEGLDNQLNTIQEETEALKQRKMELDEAIAGAEQEVAQIKEDEAALAALKDQLNVLTPEEQLRNVINNCTAESGQMFASLEQLENTQAELNRKVATLPIAPNDLVGKISSDKLDISTLSLDVEVLPAEHELRKTTSNLENKVNTLNSMVTLLEEKESRVHSNLMELEVVIDKAKSLQGDSGISKATLLEELEAIQKERANLSSQLDQSTDVETSRKEVEDYIAKFKAFKAKTECTSAEDLKNKMATIESDLTNVGQGIDQLNRQINEALTQEQKLRTEILAAQNALQQAKILKKEEESLRTAFGDSSITVKPVTTEEWSENFSVARPYWEATFHPDREMVAGYKGRYFEVNLKDASKNATILFPIGKYFMDKKTFRKQYGATIGSFVVEALFHLKKDDKNRVKLFIQGSADGVGSSTFRGNLNSDYYYEFVNVLPSTGGERFGHDPVEKSIPTSGFKNSDLPNLRAQYLKELIGVYTDKFDPIILEGIVVDAENEKERNAIIYLFIPEDLLNE